MLQLMWVQQRNIIKLFGLIQMNSRLSLHISEIFMISCSFFTKGEKCVNNSGFEEILYQARMCSVDGIRPALSGKSLQHVLGNSLSSSTFNFRNISLTN